MNRPRAVWGIALLVYLGGIAYQTLGIFREISALINAPLFSSPATAPEIVAVAAVPLSGYFLPAIALIVLSTLPPLGEAQVLPRLGSRTRAIWVPVRVSVMPVAAATAIWLAGTALLASRARWIDSWVTIDGVATLADAFSPAVPAGSVSPLGAIALAMLNLAAAYLAITAWVGLAATYVRRGAVAVGLLVLVLIRFSSGLWEEVIPIGTWVGMGGALRQFPPGLSATLVLLVIAVIPVGIALLADARRTGNVSARRIVAVIAGSLVLGMTLLYGKGLAAFGSLHAALVAELHGTRFGIDIGVSPSALLAVQVLSLLPAVVMLVRIEENISLWPMIFARGAGSLSWFLYLVRDAVVLSVAVALLPVAALLLAAVGQPQVLSGADGSDLGALAYWTISTALQSALYAVLLCAVRLVSASLSVWASAFCVLLVLPLVAGPVLVPVGLNHLLLLDSASPHDLVRYGLTLLLALILVCAGVLLALKRRLIIPEA